MLLLAVKVDTGLSVSERGVELASDVALQASDDVAFG